MNLRRALGVMVLVMFSLPGCKDPEPEDQNTDTDTDTGELDPGDGESDYVFDDTVIRTISVEIEPDDYETLTADPGSEEYVPAVVYYDGDEFLEAAIRYKGAFGSLYSCLEGFWLDVIGRDCDKLNFKLKFSEYNDDRRFFGLKRLNLHGMDKDYARTREIIAYRVFREFEVPSSRAAYVRLEINGEFMGLYLALEQVDGQFTRQRFEDGGEGNLYKEIWMDQTDPGIWLWGLETNQNENPDVTGMVEMGNELSEAAIGTFPQTLGEWFDVDELMRYLAVEQTLGHWDSTTAFYCGDWGCTNHNYYLYEFEATQHVALIPWDLDLTFANFGVPNVLEDNYGIPAWNDLEAECGYMEIGWGLAQAPACNSIVGGIASELFDDYAQNTQTLVDTIFTVDNINGWITQYTTLIEPFIQEDPYGPTAQEWEAEVEVFRGFVETLRERALDAIAPKAIIHKQ